MSLLLEESIAGQEFEVGVGLAPGIEQEETEETEISFFVSSV